MSEQLEQFIPSDTDMAVFRELFSLRPEYVTMLIENFEAFTAKGKDYLSNLPTFIQFLQEFLQLVNRSNTTSLSELTEVYTALNNLNNPKNKEGMGVFTTTVGIMLSEETNPIRYRRISLDQQSYQSDFSTPLPPEIFRLFTQDNRRAFEAGAQGLPQSLQGTLAASEILSHEQFSKALNGELNLAYPGSGSHLTPLLMAFDLIDRGMIDSANFLLIDLRDANQGIQAILNYLASENAITNLAVTQQEEQYQTQYSFTYHNQPITITFNVSSSQDLQSWNPNGRPVNVLYDHLPSNSARPGAASIAFANRPELHANHTVIHVMPTSNLPLDGIAEHGTITIVERIDDVSFADKNTWIVKGDKGVGITVAEVEYRSI
jgi:hypothetical protein